MAPKAKAFVIVFCVLLMILSASALVYFRMIGTEKEAQAPGVSKWEFPAASESDAPKLEIKFNQSGDGIKRVLESVELPIPALVAELVENLNDANESSSSEEDDSHEYLNTNEVENVPAETIIYGKKTAIYLFDFKKQVTTEVIARNTRDYYHYSYPRISPDGKLVAFFQLGIDGYQGIFVMSIHGSRPRRIIGNINASDWFDFGPNGDSIIYYGERTHKIHQIYLNSGVRASRIIELKRDQKDEKLPRRYFSCHKNYLYWSDDYMVWRKNLLDSFSEAELVFTKTGWKYITNSVSPDGNYLLMKPEGRALYNPRVIIVNIQTGNFLGPFTFVTCGNMQLKKYFWSPDCKWIYAERHIDDDDDQALVRFKVDVDSSEEPEPVELELVLNDFTTESDGPEAAFVPQFFEYENHDEVIRYSPAGRGFCSNELVSEPAFAVEIEDFDETLIFSTITLTKSAPSILSFNTGTRILRDLSGNIAGSTYKDNLLHNNQKISSDGKLIAFTKIDEFVYDISPKIYLMNSDGSNLRKIVACGRNGIFDFGPDNKSILYVDENQRLRRIDIAENNVDSIGKIVNRVKKIPVYDFSYVNGYVYWFDEIPGWRKEIWRMNMLDESAVPELVYRSGKEKGCRLSCNLGRRPITSYKVSPNGKRLIISEFDSKNDDKYIDIFDIDDENASRTDEKLPIIQEHASSIYSVGLEHIFWHTDSNGQDWIYAKRIRSDSLRRDLVRCKADELAESNFEAVIPNFISYAGVSILPKFND